MEAEGREEREREKRRREHKTRQKTNEVKTERKLNHPTYTIRSECVETYIHRSGRTGRANTKGVSITFYTPKQLFYLQNIERKAGIKFVKKG